MNPKVKISKLTKEADVALTIREYLQLRGWRVHRLTADRHSKGGNRKRHELEEPGTADYVAIRLEDQKVVYIETKRPGGGLRESQAKWIARTLMEGFDVVVADSWEEFRAVWPF